MSDVYSSTLRELEGCEVGSVVLDSDGDAWQRMARGWTCTVRVANTKEQDASSLAILAPITVIHRAPAPVVQSTEDKESDR